MKRDFITVALFLCVILLSGCKWSLEEASRYVMITTAQGEVYRLDNQTGEVHHVSPDGMFLLHDNTPVLKVGSYYEMEDVSAKGEPKFLEYLGKVQFEKSQFAIIESGEGKDRKP